MIELGSAVRVNSEQRHLHGKTGVVSRVNDDGVEATLYEVRFTDESRTWLFRSDELVVVSEVTTPEEPSQAASAEPRDSQAMSRGDALANGERMDEYGHPSDAFERIAAFWEEYLTGTNGKPVNVEGEDVGVMMILLKLSRLVTNSKSDTLDDIEGYVSCLRMLRT